MAKTLALGVSALSLVLFLAAVGCTGVAHSKRMAEQATTDEIRIGPFDSEAWDVHQRRLQEALDRAGARGRLIVIAPGDYTLSDPKGVRLPGDCTILMQGARFVWKRDVASDGQTFLLEDVSNVTLLGGEIVGQRDAWDPGTNIAGIRAVGDCHNLRLTDVVCRDLSSNAFGFFGEEGRPMTGVSLAGVRGINCCNVYGDYLSDHSGPAKGSDRKDQGTVAMYYVNDWLVDACWFEDSRSDGTHFYHSHHGRFVETVVRGSQMGGYFLEGCEDVLASGNHITGNGSRGCTIERNSRFCTLANNLVASSGREGLWAPDVEGILVANNIFRTNGRKDDADKDCEIRIDEGETYEVQTRDIRIEGNLFYTTPEQTGAVYLSDGVTDVVVMNNTFRGEAKPVHASEETRKANAIAVKP